jgi:hypothetical protein
MTRNKQRNAECVLATLCSIANVDYETTSNNFQDYFGGPWYEEICCAKSSYDYRDDILAWIRRHLRLSVPWRGVICINYFDLPMSGEHDLRGRGQLSIINRTLHHCHSAAFEDGLVFDSDKPETANGLLFDDWMKLWPRFELVRINRLVKGRLIVGEAL